MKYFFVGNLKKGIINKYLNLIKYFADPTHLNIAHITIKGPYNTKQTKIFEKEKNIVLNKKLNVIGVGNFFDFNQNTVFFNCNHDIELYKIWKSNTNRTYNTYNPHITIYDNDNISFSRELFNILKNKNLFFEIMIDEFDMYNRTRKSEIFNLTESLDQDILRDVFKQFQVESGDVLKMSEQKRLEIIEYLSSNLEKQIENN
jgi:hypothetical protein